MKARKGEALRRLSTGTKISQRHDPLEARKGPQTAVCRIWTTENNFCWNKRGIDPWYNASSLSKRAVKHHYSYTTFPSVNSTSVPSDAFIRLHPSPVKKKSTQRHPSIKSWTQISASFLLHLQRINSKELKQTRVIRQRCCTLWASRINSPLEWYVDRHPVWRWCKPRGGIGMQILQWSGNGSHRLLKDHLMWMQPRSLYLFGEEDSQVWRFA